MSKRGLDLHQNNTVTGLVAHIRNSIPYSQKVWRGIKFNSAKNFFLAYIRMTILYRAAKLKSIHIFELYVWDQIAKVSGYTVHCRT